MNEQEFRTHQWINTKTGGPVFGIQAKVNGKWLHCCANNEPILFGKKCEAEAKIKSLKDPNPH